MAPTHAFAPFSPAYPGEGTVAGMAKPGMTIYDCIATAALQAVIARQSGGITPQAAAQFAIEYADEMVKQLAARYRPSKQA